MIVSCKNTSAFRIRKFFLICISLSVFVMIRVLDLYNFGDESIVTNPVYNAMFSYVPVVSSCFVIYCVAFKTRCI